MRNALKPGTIITVNGVEYTIRSLLNANGGMSLIYEATQLVGEGGFAGNTVIKEFFPTTLAARNGEGRVICTSEDPEELRLFEELRRSMVDEGVIGEEARVACSQVYAFDHAEDGYAVMRKFSEDTRSLVDLLNAWQITPPTSDEEYVDMARLRYALRICHSILTGLQTIHDRAGIIHRDISLGNIVWASSDISKEGKDGRAYFLDFGSALKMNERREARNTTDPLKLFGTYSFAAPEIWQLGATLTPAVDLFSISAILLLLCCGKKCCIRMKQGWHLASQANIGRLYESDFVVKGAVEKLNVPAEIRGMLMDFLLEGLSKTPERRFNQSPAAMLEALERIQIKCAPRQRLREYVAFISYHHRPLDKTVARRLHRMIERYRIPTELAKDRESRKLGLVFRDEDELPVSTDLTDNIQEALDHSEYLIVICTPGTPKSIWVEAEIAYFLRHHDRNHVLAVLAEGRPEESFPPHLVHLYDTEGNVIGDTEYLAANIAANSRQETLRRLNREKLRIIAAMLGCPYDSLYQREKHYQIRRAAIAAGSVAVLLIAFISVILAKNHQLDLQYHETLINESNALSRAAQLEYQQGNTIGALEYALEAVPNEGNERPYTALSEQVLNDILKPYVFGDSQIVSILQQDTKIESIAINMQDSYVYSMDQYGVVRAYDWRDGALAWTVSIDVDTRDSDLSFVYLEAYNGLLVHSSKQTCLVNAETGDVIWNRDDVRSRIHISDDRKTIVAFGRDYVVEPSHEEIMQEINQMYEATKLYKQTGNAEDLLVSIPSRDMLNYAQFLNMEDGSIVRTVNCNDIMISDSILDLEYPNEYMVCEQTFIDIDHFYSVSYSADTYDKREGEMIIYAIEDGLVPRVLYRQSYRLGDYDITSNLPHPIAMRYYEDDQSILVVFLDDVEQSMSLIKVSALDGSVIYTKEYARQHAFSAKQGCFMSTTSHAFLTIDNDIFCFDVKTGDMKAKALDNSWDFIGLWPVPDCNNGGYVINENGVYCLFGCIDGDMMFSNFDHQRMNLGPLSCFAIGENCLPLSDFRGDYGYFVDMNPLGVVAVCPKASQNQIMVYSPHVAWDYCMNGIEMDWDEYIVDRTGRYLVDRSNCRGFDLENEQPLDLPGWNAITDYDDLVVSDANETITYLGNDRICVFSTKEGKNSEIDLPTLTTSSYDLHSVTAMAVRPDGSTLVSSFDNHTLWCWVDGQRLDVPSIKDMLPQYEETCAPIFENPCRVLTDGRFVVIASEGSGNASEYLVYDTEKTQWKLILGEQRTPAMSPRYTERAVCLSETSGKLAYISKGGQLVIYDLQTGKFVNSFDMAFPPESVEDLLFVDNDRSLICLESTHVIAYDLETGNAHMCEYSHQFIGATLETSMSNMAFDSEQRRLYVADPSADEAGICIDMVSWTRIAAIPYLIGHTHKTNDLILYDFPAYWHPNVIGYDVGISVPEGTYGICKIPALNLDELSRQGLEVLHMIHSNDATRNTLHTEE